MGSMPGFGDPATWGRVTDKRDPRYDDSAEIAESTHITEAIKRVRTLLDTAETAAGAPRLHDAHAAIEQAIDELQELVP